MTDGKEILDVACGSRMFYFNKYDPRVVYCDNRQEEHLLKDKKSKGGVRHLVIDPELKADFTRLPFADNSYTLVCFDPPHLCRAGKNGWLAKKYGVLGNDWRNDIRLGFSECFRVLRSNGVLIFKWNESQIKLSEILKLTPYKPVFGNKGGRHMFSHWLVFHKEN